MMSVVEEGAQDMNELPNDGETGQWYPVPLPPTVNVGTLWHYTSAEGLVGIIESGQIWASSPRVMNDITEIEFGVDRLREAFESLSTVDIPKPCLQFLSYVLDYDMLEAIQASAYVASASLERDLLNQWAQYAGTDGFAIGIDVARPIRTQTVSAAFLQGWRKVIYDHQAQVKAATDMLTFLANSTPGTPIDWESKRGEWPKSAQTCRFLLQGLALELKHSAFADEREVRYVASRYEGELPKFRTARGRLIPYLPIGEPPKQALAVTEVVCGPTSRPGTEQAVRTLLLSAGLSGVVVSTSSVPYLGKRP